MRRTLLPLSACITASAAAPPAAPSRWFSIRAEAGQAELKLRGYIGQAKTYVDYWGEEHATGGAGTLQEFEHELSELGDDVDQINLYLTSEGGDFPTAIAISSILARQKARIVCTIDGYAYSAAPVIACAADEIRAAGNALLMIHDAEFWCSGADVETLEKHIETLRACNASMAAAFVNKAGGTEAEWMKRMVATTWLTGAQAKEIGLVDTLLDDVALSAYEPLKKVTAALRAPDAIRALIDSGAGPEAKPKPNIQAMLRPRTPLFTAAAEAPAAGGAPAAPAATPAVETPATPAAAAAPAVTAAAPQVLTLEAIQGAVTAAVKPLQERLDKLEGVHQHQQAVTAHGIPAATAAAPAPVAAKPASAPQHDLSKMTACELIALGRAQQRPAA